MAKKRKRPKPDRDWQAFEARSEATIRRVRELVAEGEARAAQRRPGRA